MQSGKRRAAAIAIVLAAGIALTLGSKVQAHRAVTSPYSYNEHVYPILRDHCGSCHVEGGAAPMSLLTYQDQATGGAFAWAQSIREMLVSEAMPPWYADPTGPAVQHARGLTSRELDIVVTWASGGAPEGDPDKKPQPAAAHAQWALGKPDLVIPMPMAHEVAADKPQENFEVVLSPNLPAAKWVKAADLLPGTPNMVRRARISVVDGPVLALWEPGDEGMTAPEGTAFRLNPGAKIRLELFYKKSWQEEQEAKSDRSSIGLYFVNAAAASEISSLAIAVPKSQAQAPTPFTAPLTAAGRVVAVRPQVDTVYSTMEVTAVTPSGQRLPLIKLHAARPEWPRRYWLDQPVTVPAGSTIEVKGTPSDIDPGPASKAMNAPLEIGLDIARQ